MRQLQIFTDGSVNTKTKVGYGAYLATRNGQCIDQQSIPGTSKDKVHSRRFENTSSTKLELQTFLWAVKEVQAAHEGLKFTLAVYTDSQNIVTLPQRRVRLEQRNFLSSKNKPLKNQDLYKEFYQLASEVEFDLIKVVGHQSSKDKDEIGRLFSLVDKVARSALREASD